MNIQHAINVGSAGVASIALSLSLPLCIDRLSDDAPSPSLPAPSLPLPANVPDGIEGEMLPALVTTPDSTLVYVSQLPPCDHEDGTSSSNGVDVPACIWDATTRGNGSGMTFIVIAR
jgi:hypothetical protein